jgi:hypothetical protein
VSISTRIREHSASTAAQCGQCRSAARICPADPLPLPVLRRVDVLKLAFRPVTLLP